MSGNAGLLLALVLPMSWLAGCAGAPVDYEPTRAWLDQYEQMPQEAQNCVSWDRGNPGQVYMDDYNYGRYRRAWAQGDYCGAVAIAHRNIWERLYIGTSQGGSYTPSQNVNVWVTGYGVR